MIRLNKGNAYTSELIRKFYIRCDTDIRFFSYTGLYSIWKKNNSLDSTRDIGERFVLKSEGKHIYKCEKIYNVDVKDDK